ncbi:AraC family transcriptional regulator [Dyadobacter pollutisoli]|uniref:AraC family transcriptional regulator n=1 Tax=Dyadobacter pollutisoli TaxID=2910158 RepID=A0A9E8NB72_9BACT|nr:AraC family transcriptional regulator [Dyadobacter pollutisoli]WAC12743.1 AraC family transcriptional regulator [Dyadobacter pollutisoli]
MKPQLLKVPTAPAYSFSVRQDKIPNLNNRWHYHPEIELIHFHRGSGTQFVGDSIKRFGKGDIVLVGSNLPHYWRDDEQDLNKSPYSTVIHFSPDFWGDRFLELAENKPIRQILEKAQRGLLLSGGLHQKVALLMDKILRAEGTDRIIVLLEMLLCVSRSDDYSELSSMGYQSDLSESDSDRINAIYNYTLSRFNQKITLSEIAGVAGMVPNAFCRYFKSRTGKTYSQFLTEIRVGHSCRLLMESDISIKQLCFESGFMNFSCFHKRFKSVTGQSPQGYRHAFIHAGKQ